MNHMDTELYRTVMSGNNEVLKQLAGRLNVGDQLTPTNYTALHLASQYGNVTCVEEILRTHEFLLLKVNSRGETPLHLAARGGHYDVAKTLIDAAKSSLLQLNHLQSTSSTILEFLIWTANVDFNTALHEAVRYNHLSVVELLVTEDPTHTHVPNKHDETPLYLASFRGYKDIITTILDKCVSPTYGGPDRRTALHAAILNEDEALDCVKLLLGKRKELIRVTDDYGWTAFHYVAYQDHYTIVKDLVDADKSVAYLQDKKYKRIALHIAAYEGCLDVMEELLLYCPDSCDIVDGSGRNILHIAVKRNHKEIIRYISKNCKEINSLLIQKDEHGNTPLHLMAMLGCYVPQVMDHNHVDWEVLNGENLTPLDIIDSGSGSLLNDQSKISEALVHANAKTHWNLGRILNKPDYENGQLQNLKEDMVEISRRVMNTQSIVAALIATVALTAGFAMPGGFDGNAGPNQGSPVLLKKTAFRTFVVTDAIALLCSLSSLFVYFMTVAYSGAGRVLIVAFTTMMLNVLSIIAMMVAFITGTYAVLAHSLALAAAVSVISSLFFLLVFFFQIYHILMGLQTMKYEWNFN